MRGFKFFTNETEGFDVPVTFENKEQAERMFFLTMLNDENRQKVFNYIMQLTQEEDCCRWSDKAYADEDINEPISFVREEEENEDD